MHYDPYRRIDRMGWGGMVRLLAVLFVASLVLTTALFASVRLGILDRGTLERYRAVDWKDIQVPAPAPSAAARD